MRDFFQPIDVESVIHLRMNFLHGLVQSFLCFSSSLGCCKVSFLTWNILLLNKPVSCMCCSTNVWLLRYVACSTF